jgi:hypothetical protein
MKLATLACLSALCLNAALAHAAPGEPAAKSESTTQSPAAQTGVPGRGEPAAARGDGKETSKGEAARSEASKGEVGKGERQASGRDRRRPSYAACNRASHQRGYRGGRRRRFLIRCRLGYERPRAQQHQTPAAPANPVRKP